MLQTNSYNHRDAGEESLGNAFPYSNKEITCRNQSYPIEKVVPVPSCGAPVNL